MQVNLMRAQTTLLREATFNLIPAGPIAQVDDHLFRESVRELSAGRYVHIIQSVEGFVDWPQRAFGSITPCGPDWVRTVADSIEAARSSLQQRDGFVEGMTLWLAGGWGAGRSFILN